MEKSEFHNPENSRFLGFRMQKFEFYVFRNLDSSRFLVSTFKFDHSILIIEEDENKKRR